MINDVIRRVSREHTLVIAERSRDDPNLPTDLWKKSVCIYAVYRIFDNCHDVLDKLPS